MVLRSSYSILISPSYKDVVHFFDRKYILSMPT